MPKPAVRVTVFKGTCTIVSTMVIVCPLCGFDVPPDTIHECERDGAVRVVRQRPARTVAEKLAVIAGGR